MDRHKINIWIGLGVIVIFIFYILFQFLFSSEEGRVRKFILKGKRAVETKNILIGASMVSTNYHDKYGNSRDSLIYAAKEAFAYYGNIFIRIEEMKIRLNESKTQANVEIEALVLCESKENKREKIFEGERGRCRVNLIKEDKNWRLLEVEFLEEVTIMGQNII